MREIVEDTLERLKEQGIKVEKFLEALENEIDSAQLINHVLASDHC